MKKARIFENVAVDVTAGNPGELFHPEIASQFVDVPDQVENGWTLNAGIWSAPTEPVLPPVQAVEAPKVSPVEFKLLFTSAERIAIKASADPVVQDFFEIVNDPRLTHVDLGLQSTKDAIAYLASINLLTAERAAAILAGNVQ